MKKRKKFIQYKIRRAILVTSCAVLLLSGMAFFIYEFWTFRDHTVDRVSILAEVIANNSTAALAFNSPEEAYDILSALRAEKYVVAAVLYDDQGDLFSKYPKELDIAAFPDMSNGSDGYFFDRYYLHGVEPVVQGSHELGKLYLRYDLDVLYSRFGVFGLIAVLIFGLSLILVYLLSTRLQRQISRPIVDLAGVATSVAVHQDYSVRAEKQSDDEIGLFTEAFNQMLARIEQQNQDLLESENRIRSVINSSLTAVIVMNQEGNITEWNSRAEDMFGWSGQEAQGKKLSGMIIPSNLIEAHNEGLTHFLETGEGPILNRLLEMTARKRDGREFPVELSVSPLKTGDTTSFCGFITDITERKESEKKLQAQLYRLDLMSHITRAIGERMDLQSIFQVVIQSLEDQLPVDFGCIGLYDQADDLLIVNNVGSGGHGLFDNWKDADSLNIGISENALSKCLGGDLIYEPEIDHLERPFFQKLNSANLRSVVITPLALESNVFGALICARKALNGFTSGDCEFLSQLSEHVALAAHQAQLHEALQKAYYDLRQTQQTVLQQERLRALGQMSSGIAHDINNAISPVALYTEALLETEPNLSENGRRYLEIIQQAMDDVAKTVARMREFYRKKEPQMSLTSINLNQLINQVIELTRAKWFNIPQQKGVVITIEKAFHPDLPHVMGVENEIREALTNLIFNAVDAMPEGGTLRLGTQVREDDFDPKSIHPTRKSVSLEVTDTGVGMDEETRIKCLEPFFTTKGERGTGLGLAMVYGAVQRHGADIEVESAPGEGTTVRLIFPAGTKETTEPVPIGTTSSTPSRLRILVIDDDPLILRSLQDTLEKDGHQITCANGGQSGIELFMESVDSPNRFDLVVTDLGMPYVDGRKVAEAIKEQSPATPVIMLTGWGQRILDGGELPNHVDHLISKPPKLRDLRDVLSRYSYTVDG